MDLLDPHTMVISAVLIVHFLGVFIIAVCAAALLICLFVVVMAVHGVRRLRALTGKPA